VLIKFNLSSAQVSPNHPINPSHTENRIFLYRSHHLFFCVPEAPLGRLLFCT